MEVPDRRLCHLTHRIIDRVCKRTSMSSVQPHLAIKRRGTLFLTGRVECQETSNVLGKASLSLSDEVRGTRRCKVALYVGRTTVIGRYRRKINPSYQARCLCESFDMPISGDQLEVVTVEKMLWSLVA